MPVFTDCAQAVAETGAQASVLLVGALQLLDAMRDALAAGIRYLVTPTEGMPVSFYVCAVWKKARPNKPCEAFPGVKLPPNTQLRLEQQPIGPAVTNPDTPGWGTVATSPTADLQAVLSNFVTGNTYGTFTYRATLRDPAGTILARSNTFKITWHP